MTAYETITKTILDSLEKGVVPWRRPWSGAPRNMVSKKEYHGINSVTTGMTGEAWFCTFAQAKELGGNVKKGAKGIPVVFFSFPQAKEREEEEDNGKDEKAHCGPIYRVYYVFRISDIENIDKSKFSIDQRPGRPIDKAEEIIAGMQDRPKIRYEGGSAYYRPLFDDVTVPPQGLFSSPEEYYSTIFHELSHSTGHEKRLNRPGIVDHVKFAGHEYGKEELVAEFSASFLCGEAGIDRKTVGNSASYIDSWKRAIKADLRMVIQAAGQAQRAADYILGKKPLTGE